MHVYLVNSVSVMMHNSCVAIHNCVALDYNQMKAYMGNYDKKHSNGLLRMVKGEVPKLAKPWSLVKHVFMSFNLQR